jgi:HPt (histidine-containing phosphotransfer) domain-containing protein
MNKPIEKIDCELEPLIEKFMKNSWSDFEIMQNAYSKKNYTEIQRIGHNIKGSSLNYGFLLMGELGRKIEISAAGENDVELEGLLNVFKDYLENVVVEFVD